MSRQAPAKLPYAAGSAASLTSRSSGLSFGSAAGGIAQPSPAEMIRVAAQAPIANSEGTQLSTTITSEFLSEIPVLGCDYQDVLALAPGVTLPGVPARLACMAPGTPMS